MPWYKSGTVSVTSNSNAVIGTGTTFLSNGRVGDAFRGPDGAWYEIINIASDTAMSISPVYNEATNAAGAYALAPMQGYVKDSADALRSLVNTYGAKLAALGTTGNYDLLPVTKGGTGGDTAASARANLGLVLQSGVSDATDGRILGVGAFGWNGGTVISMPNTALVRDLTVPGVYGFGSGGLDLPVVGQAWYVRVCRHGALILLEALGMASANQGQYLTQNYNGSVWSGWVRQALAGANSDITSLTGLTTALSVGQGGTGVTSLASLLSALGLTEAYKKSNIVGTVSQSGGTPTGAIIETGTTANGTYTKWADGTMICTRKVNLGVPGWTLINSPIYYYAAPGFDYAASFVGVPVVEVSISYSSTVFAWAAQGSTLATSSKGPAVVILTYSGTNSVISFDQVAIGRWF